MGGTTAAARNLISANAVGVLTQSGTNQLIQGNFIGTDKTGNVALANATDVDVRSDNCTVGGTAVSARNIIAGNGNSGGISLSGGNGDQIQGNFIGTNVTGTQALGFANGIFLSNGATNTLIGGLTATPGTPPGNLISGNQTGVFVSQSQSNNTIQGNLIGTNAAGTAALSNSLDGVVIQGAFNLVGGSTTTARNVISGNGLHGIFLGTNNASVHDNMIQGNFIGTKINGSGFIPNASDGIFVVESFSNTVGGSVATAGAPPANVIAGNGGNGIGISFGAFGVTGLAIKGNSIFSNGGLGIDLNENGVTLNDVGDADSGTNNLQNFPVLSSVTNSGGMTTIAGTLDSIASKTYRIEFFANDAIDATGFGEGQIFLGFTNASTNASGNASFNVSFPQIGAGQRVTSTATDPNGNTSEFSGANGQLLNISTRLGVQTGNNVLIGGFIIGGTGNKQLLLRALGPTLTQFGVGGALADPTLELRDGAGALIATNDNWKDTQQAAITATGLAPPDDKESAILHTFAPGNNTAIVRGKNNTTGVGLVEAYDLDQAVSPSLTNISTRGFVDTGNNVMIGGFISGNGLVKVLVRALGPTLSQFGVPDVLADPTLELREVNGTLVASNDNWQDTQQADIQASGFAPPNTAESAIIVTRPPGNTTAVVSGKNNTTGNALVEVYILSQ